MAEPSLFRQRLSSPHLVGQVAEPSLAVGAAHSRAAAEALHLAVAAGHEVLAAAVAEEAAAQRAEVGEELRGAGGKVGDCNRIFYCALVKCLPRTCHAFSADLPGLSHK